MLESIRRKVPGKKEPSK